MKLSAPRSCLFEAMSSSKACNRRESVTTFERLGDGVDLDYVQCICLYIHVSGQ